MQAAANETAADRSAFFVMVRSMWLPSNEFQAASSVAAAAVSCTIFQVLSEQWSWHQLPCCALLTLLLEWLVLHAVRTAEDIHLAYSEDVRADRAVMPVAVLSLPAAALGGTVWAIVGGARAVWPR